ncbi:MAG TPA: arginine--tRNA ligase [Gaiellaceae bacterium]
MSRRQTCVERLAARLDRIAGAPVELERPKNPEHGDFATSVALRTAGVAGLSPRELADQLAARLAELDEVASAEVAGPGFVNLRLADGFFLEALGEIGDAYGGGFADPPARVQVEMVSANPTGPVVVSAARNGALGDSVARLLEFGGHRVDREYYYNDAGTQIDRFRASVDALRRGEEIPEDGYRGSYVADLAAAEGDPVPRMLHSIEATMERFRIHFDGWALQSSLEQRLPELLPRLDTYEKEGALWARSSAYGDEQDWVLVRSADRGGTPTYRAADVAYLVDKLERGYDRAIYVLGADHHATARWYGAIARMLGYDPERVEVLLYQFVHLTGGGATAKASKRAGNVVFLDELLDEIGVDAARWYLVNRGPDQTIDIDLDLAAEKSNKNPVFYVQYAHARIAAILRNAEGAEEGGPSPGPLADEEKELIKRLTDFPATVREAAERRGPQLLPAYAIRVADDFHRFYHECRVLGDPAQAFRLQLCRAAQRVVACCLDLVGVEAPDRM